MIVMRVDISTLIKMGTIFLTRHIIVVIFTNALYALHNSKPTIKRAYQTAVNIFIKKSRYLNVCLDLTRLYVKQA